MPTVDVWRSLIGLKESEQVRKEDKFDFFFETQGELIREISWEENLNYAENEAISDFFEMHRGSPAYARKIQTAISSLFQECLLRANSVKQEEIDGNDKEQELRCHNKAAPVSNKLVLNLNKEELLEYTDDNANANGSYLEAVGIHSSESTQKYRNEQETQEMFHDARSCLLWEVTR